MAYGSPQVPESVGRLNSQTGVHADFTGCVRLEQRIDVDTNTPPTDHLADAFGLVEQDSNDRM